MKSFSTIFATLLLSTAQLRAEQTIFENLGSVGDKTFYKSEESTSIWGASSGCDALGMDLVAIETAAENNFLMTHSSIGIFVSYWTGAVVVNDGSDMIWHYSGEPVDQAIMPIPGQEVTAALTFSRLSRIWQLNTIYSIGGSTHPYVCQQITSQNRTVRAGALEKLRKMNQRRPFYGLVKEHERKEVAPSQDGLQLLGLVGNKEFYVDLLAQITWNSSLHTCEGLGMQLAEISNLEESEFLKTHPLLGEWHRFWVAGRVFIYPADLTWGSTGNSIDYTLGQMDPNELYHRHSLTFVGLHGDGYFEQEGTRRPYLCQILIPYKL